MVNIFEYKDYREFLTHLTSNRSARGQTKAELARSMGCQAAYLSQVLGSKADLTEDHGVKMCQALNFSDTETEYFLLILRLSRAGTKTLSEYLEQKRLALKKQYSEVDSRITAVKKSPNDQIQLYYCSSWIPSVVHAATSCPHYQTAQAIAERLALSKQIVEKHLETLEKYQLIKFSEGKWIHSGNSIHFPKNSLMDATFQLNQRLLGLNSINRRQPEDVHYSMVFPANKETASKFRELFLNTIEKIHKDAASADSEDVYAISMDFFKV